MFFVRVISLLLEQNIPFVERNSSETSTKLNPRWEDLSEAFSAGVGEAPSRYLVYFGMIF